MIPSDLALGDTADVDEERRLFYVAMTRAKNWLYMYFPLRHYHHRRGVSDAHGYAQLTRFLPQDAQRLFEHRVAYETSEDEPMSTTVCGADVDRWVRGLWTD
jgi:DNA helicase-2/ATP-dependent DNA helicase PcrA